MKKNFAKFLITALLTVLTSASVNASENIVIRDSATNEEALQIQELTGLYGEVSFDAPKTGTAFVATAAYDADGTLLSVKTSSKEMTAGTVFEAKTEAVDSSLAEMVKVFAWDKADMSPIIKKPRIIVKNAADEEKFIKKAVSEVKLWETITLGNLFAESSEELENPIKSSDVQVTVAGAEYTYEKNDSDWKKSTLVMNSLGTVTITITDNRLCKTAENQFAVAEPDPVERYEVIFKNTDKYTYRVGNENAVSVASLFKATEGAEITSDSVEITVESVKGNANGEYTRNASDWTKGTIQFNGTGIVNVTVKDGIYSVPKTVQLEVVDAKNSTGASSATSGNIVLLNDCGFGSLEVSNGYAIYGNGFKMTCSSDSVALDTGYSFVTLNNGTLDNVQIICPNFSHAVLYSSNMTESANQSETDANGKTRYHNVRSAIMATGNNTISNSYVSGGRVAVYVTSGTTVFDNTTINGGAVANVQVGSSVSGVVFKDATLVQVPTQANVNDTSKTLLGFSVLLTADDSGVSAPVTLEGDFIQYAWLDESVKKYVPSDAQSIVGTLLAKTDYIHNINGAESLNAGIVCMTAEAGKTVKVPNINDNRTNKDTVPYGFTEVTVGSSTLARVYSIKNSVAIDSSLTVKPEFTPDKYNEMLPVVSYSDTNEKRVFSKEYDTAKGWVNKLLVDLDAGAYFFDFAKVKVIKNGSELDFAVADASGNSVDKSKTIALAVGNLDYVLTAVDVEGKEYKLNFTVSATKTSINSPELVAANYAAGLCVASSYGGTWSGAAPALEGIQIKYWSVAESDYKTIKLSDYTPTTPGKLNGTNTTWTYTHTNNDFTLTLTGGQVHSKNNIYAMPVVCNSKLYFVSSSSNGLVNTGNTARTIPVSYVFKDNATDESLTFSHTWSVAENKDEEYKYSDFCSGTLTKLESSSGGINPCVTPETLITLADGTKKRIDELTYSDELLVWNFVEGKYDISKPAIIFDHGYSMNKLVKLNFADGTFVNMLNLHQFFDATLNKFVTLTDENVSEFVGHKFAKANGDTYENVELVNYEIKDEYNKAMGVISAKYCNIITNGMISTDVLPEDYLLFNFFEMGEDMKYDAEKMQADIEKYGLYTYEEFADYLTIDEFYALNCNYLKIAVGKGYYTFEDLLEKIEYWGLGFSENENPDVVQPSTLR